MKHAISNLLACLLSGAFLSACGGGDIIFSGPVTVTGNTITVPVTASVAASAPAPAASAPAPAPTPDPIDAVPVPLATILTGSTWPATLDRGQFQFCSGGICYSVVVRDLGEWGHITALLRNTNPSAGGAWTGVSTLDQGTGNAGHAPPGAGAAEVRQYLLSYIVPQVNTWLSANPSLFSAGVVVKPQTTLALDGLTGPALAAAMFARHARISAGANPVVTLVE